MLVQRFPHGEFVQVSGMGLAAWWEVPADPWRCPGLLSGGGTAMGCGQGIARERILQQPLGRDEQGSICCVQSREEEEEVVVFAT